MLAECYPSHRHPQLTALSFAVLSTCMGEPIRHTFDWWWQGLVDAAESRRSRMRYERVPAFGMSQAGEEFEMLDRAARGQSERYY